MPRYGSVARKALRTVSELVSFCCGSGLGRDNYMSELKYRGQARSHKGFFLGSQGRPEERVAWQAALSLGNSPAGIVLAELTKKLGWEPLDVGGLEQALHLEHMTLLWVRMVRVDGRSPHMVWAMLTR